MQEIFYTKDTQDKKGFLYDTGVVFSGNKVYLFIYLFIYYNW